MAMFDHAFFIARMITVGGAAVIAGTFFAFSIFIMRSLNEVSVASAIAVMQTINRLIVRSLFLPIFVGTAILSLLLASATWLGDFAEHSQIHYSAAAFCYVVGVFGVTMIFNVPRNNALATLQADAADASVAWGTYSRNWTRFNHVRTLAAILTIFFLVIG